MAKQWNATGMTKLDFAAGWLRQILTAAPRFPADIHATADDLGIEWRTMRRAKELLGVESVRQRIVQSKVPDNVRERKNRKNRKAFKGGHTAAEPAAYREPGKYGRVIPGHRAVETVELGVPLPTKAVEHGDWYWRLPGDDRVPLDTGAPENPRELWKSLEREHEYRRRLMELRGQHPK